MDYLYELRDGEAILSTGQLSSESDLKPEDILPFGEKEAVVIEVTFALSSPPRLLLNLRG